jgi:hypothetical protein
MIDNEFYERKSRWECNSKIHVPGISSSLITRYSLPLELLGLPTALPANLAPEQVESYVLHVIYTYL